MQFKEAAYEVLKEAGKLLRGKEITDLARQKAFLALRRKYRWHS